MIKQKEVREKHVRLVTKGVTCFFISLLPLLASAQDNPPNASLRSLLQLAESNYPLLKSKALDVQAAQKDVDISKSSFIPSLDAAYQAGYATYNNITGMAYPQYLIPISGPPSATNNMSGVFGSAAALLLNWQPVSFGQRQAQAAYSMAGAQYAGADAQNEIFRHKVKVINTYLDVLAISELVKVSEENLARADTNLSLIRTLVETGIKPGADSALFKSEVSKAKIDLLNTRKLKAQILINLSQLLATDSLPPFSDTSYFNKLPADFIAPDSIQNPLLSLYNSLAELNKNKRNTLAKTMMPTLGVWGTAYARGSGIEYNGHVKSIDGLAFQRYNYGLGVQLSVPLLQYARLKPQLQRQDLLIKSSQEKVNEVSLQLKKEKELASVTLSNSIAVAKETPLFYESASFSYKALLSRYQSGLANISDLIQAQYALAKALADNRAAYIEVWKAFLYKAAAVGDLNLFLQQVN